LGTGKSSVLYAIDFAFFGEPIGRSYDYLLKENAEQGKVIVKFVKNGKEYVIQRALKRQKDRITQDIEHLSLQEEGKVIAETKNDAVAEQLFSIIGFDKEIFREIVWMRQEHLKDVLNMTAADRQKHLDKLFSLSDYEDAWTNLRQVIAGFEKESEILRRDPDVAGINDLRSQRNKIAEEIATKEKEIMEIGVKLSEAKKIYEQSSALLESLESIRRANEDLRKQESTLQVKLEGIQQSLNRLAEEIQKRQSRIVNLKKRLVLLNSQLSSYQEKLRELGLSPILTLEQLLNYRQTLQAEILSNLGQEESLRSDISRLTQRISSLAKENTCPLCLQTLDSNYREELMQKLYNEIDENKRRLKNIEEATEKHESLQKNLEAVIQSFQIIQTRTEEIKGQIEDEQKMLNETQQHFNMSQKDEKTLDAELGLLRLKIRKFNVSDLEKAQEESRVAYEQYSDLNHRVQTLELSISEATKRMQTIEERLLIAQQKKSRLERVSKAASLAQEIRQAYRSVQPRLRTEFVRYLERIVQQVLDELSGAEGSAFIVRIDENYTPIVEEEKGCERSIMNLSGGERTLLAFAYRLGLGQLIMHWKTGHGLPILLLDEPTESLGREDGSIDRLAESLSRLKTVEQVIAVTHNEGFAEKADHVIRLEKPEDKSVAYVER